MTNVTNVPSIQVTEQSTTTVNQSISQNLMPEATQKISNSKSFKFIDFHLESFSIWNLSRFVDFVCSSLFVWSLGTTEKCQYQLLNCIMETNLFKFFF